MGILKNKTMQECSDASIPKVIFIKKTIKMVAESELLLRHHLLFESSQQMIIPTNSLSDIHNGF